MSSKLKLEKPVVIVEKSLAAKQRLGEALRPFCPPFDDKIKKAKDPAEAMKLIKDLIAVDMGVDMVISDVFSSEDMTVLGLVREMEKIPGLWNTPLIVYTNDTEEATYHGIQSELAHLPFRMVPKNSSVETIGEVVSNLLEFKIENRHYLEIETKVAAFLQTKNLSLLPTALQMIDKGHKEYPSHCTPSRINLLKGELYSEFWRLRNRDMESLIGEFQKLSPSDPDFARTEKSVANLGGEIADLKNNAERYLLAAYHLEPESWKCLHSFYRFYMEAGEFKKAKEYLSKLIQAFPAKAEYSFRMGKIHELEGDLSGAIQCYLDAFHSTLEEGVGNFDAADVMEVIDASLNVGREIMSEIGLAHIETGKMEPGSMDHAKAVMLRRNNAQIRSALLTLAGKQPKNADYLNKIGITYRRAGDYPNAIDMYSRALEIDPDNSRIRVNQAVVLALCGTWDQALKEAEKARALNDGPEDAQTIAGLVDIIGKKDQKRLLKILS